MTLLELLRLLREKDVLISGNEEELRIRYLKDNADIVMPELLGELTRHKGAIVDMLLQQGAMGSTLQEVREKWEQVQLRIKSRKNGPMIAALLMGCTVEDIGHNARALVVVIRTKELFCYTPLRKQGHREVIEWAVQCELQRDCRVRILPPLEATIQPAYDRQSYRDRASDDDDLSDAPF